jgi:hypothetical protein
MEEKPQMPRNIYEIGERLAKSLRDRYPGIEPAKYGVDVAAGTKDGVPVGIASAASIAVAAFLIDGGPIGADAAAEIHDQVAEG